MTTKYDLNQDVYAIDFTLIIIVKYINVYSFYIY